MLSFKEYYNESVGKDHLELSNILKDAESKGVEVFLHYKNKIADLVHIRVPRDSSGLGTSFMNNLIRWADTYGVLIHLSAARKGELKSKDSKYKEPSSNKRLIEFYKRFGFVENRGRRKRYDISDTMYREPVNRIKSY
jgi:hypothetical protein